MCTVVNIVGFGLGCKEDIVEIVSVITKPSSTITWHQELEKKDCFITLKVEPANWLAKIIGKFVKIRMVVDIASFFDGKLFLVRVYNRVLSPDEISALYEHDKEVFEKTETPK